MASVDREGGAALIEAHRLILVQGASLAQAQDDKNSAWVHGYLHRIKGKARASRWYRSAGRSVSSAPPKKEWEEIVVAILRGQE